MPSTLSDEYGSQEQRPAKKKKQDESKVAFELDKVFGGKANELDEIEADLSKVALDASRYRAQKGQSGDRKSSGGPSNDPDRYESQTERVV